MDPGVDGRRDDGRGTGLTRRQYLTALGAGGLVSSLAGCGEPNDIVDSPQVFGYQFPYDAESVHLGPWSASDPLGFYPILHEAMSHKTPGQGRRLGDVVDSVDSDGSTADVALAEGFSWWSGDPVTARDVWIEDRIQSFVTERPTPDVELLDDYRLRYEFDRPLDRPLVLSTVASGAVRTHADTYEPWLDRLRDAGTEDERAEIISDLRGNSRGLQEIADEGLGCGPYELVEVSINRLMFERFDDHPRADEISIPRLWFPVVQEVSIENLIKKGWLDGGNGLLRNERGSPPEHLEQLARFRVNSGTKLVLDWRNDHLARPGVRRAILSALPVDDVVEVASWGEPTRLQTGLAAPGDRRWLPEALRDKLHEYPIEADEDRAAEYMRAAGYTRDGNDRWRGPDDRLATIQMGTPVWNNFVSASEVVSETLERFGFDVSIDRVSNTNIHYDITNHTYDLMLWRFDGWPYSVYDVSSDAATSIGYGVSGPDEVLSSQGKPVEPSVPETPGEVDASDADRHTVDLFDAWRDIQRPSDRATTVDAISTFATWWNDALPDIYLGTSVGGLWGNTRDFEWPEYDSDTEYGAAGPGNQPVFHLLKQGVVEPAADE
ncbi:ABC transporter substrate-binding protein [Halosimplex salinum]|uniref:ABC transporter substrate-binding protein n=1 Tax=Halosimplex salinum TaxID=1710538 RepID=UPI000F498F69|nr:ABC transporter substrate-binding protein [Halosimplex salinum]